MLQNSIPIRYMYRLTATHTLPCDIELPASKSISNRALIIAALAQSAHLLHGLATCDDTQRLIEALQNKSHTIDINNAGTAMRFLTAYFSNTPYSVTLTGSQRMRQRPISPLVDALRQIGAHITYCNQEGYPPLHIEGDMLQGGAVTIPGYISSQFISALLLIAPYTTQGIHITLQGDVLSRPYIDMTIAMMQHFGAEVSCHHNTITVAPGTYKAIPYDIEADYSAASYWYQIATLSNNTFRLKGLQPHSIQGDARVAKYFALWGVNTTFDNHGAVITPSATTHACDTLHLCLKDEPDLAQTIVMTCALRGQHFCIEGLDNLRIKETDRIEALINEAGKLGYRFTQPREGCLAWDGTRCNNNNPIVIDTHNDHRMAMAFAPAAICFDSIYINNPEVVVKSYPSFWEDLKKAGFNITHV